MGLPEIKITFSRKAATFISRSGRGMVVLILQDTTRDQIITPYMAVDEVDSGDWTATNMDYIRMVFKGGPSRLVCVRAVPDGEGINLADTLKLFDAINFDYMAMPGFKPGDGDTVKAFLKKQRQKGGKAKAVLPSFAGDYEGIINFVMDDIMAVWEDGQEVKSYTAAEYCCRMAGILAGLPLTRSSTYYVLDEIVDLEQTAAPDDDIDAGKLILVFDGEKYKIGRGVTSLVTVSETAPEDFKKIKIVEGADLIRNDIYTTFEDTFVGKLNNTYDNKQNFVGACRAYFTELLDTVLDREEENYVEIDRAANEAYLKGQGRDTEDMSAQKIAEANTGSSLFLSGKIKFLDAMEDLQMNLVM